MNMPKRNKHDKRPKDVNLLAHHLVELSAVEPDSMFVLPPALSAYMAAIGSKGGKIGGKRRMKTMTPKQRTKIAKKAARARWAKPK
jgi:hypothetical protein